MRLSVLSSIISLASALAGCAWTHREPMPAGGPIPASVLSSIRFMAFDRGSVWALLETTSPAGSWGGEGRYGYHLVRVDTAQCKTSAPIDLGERMNQRDGRLAVGNGSIWIGRTPGTVVQVDETTGHVLHEYTLAKPGWWRGNETPLDLCAGDDGVWVLVWGTSNLYHIDTSLGRINTIPLPTSLGAPTGLTLATGSVWIAHWRGMSRVDVHSQVIRATIPFPMKGFEVASDGEYIWAATAFELNLKTTRVLRVNAEKGRIDLDLSVPRDLRVAGDKESGMWLVGGSQAWITPLGPGRVRVEDRIAIADPEHARFLGIGAGCAWFVTPSGLTKVRLPPRATG